VAALSYPSPARAAQAALLIQSVEHPVRELIDQWNLERLRKELRDLECDACLLAAPIRQVNFSETLTGHLWNQRNIVVKVARGR
jgi:hypothetical protein